MQVGPSRELFELWAPDSRNGLIITGYSIEGTLARVSHRWLVFGDGYLSCPVYSIKQWSLFSFTHLGALEDDLPAAEPMFNVRLIHLFVSRTS